MFRKQEIMRKSRNATGCTVVLVQGEVCCIGIGLLNTVDRVPLIFKSLSKIGIVEVPAVVQWAWRRQHLCYAKTQVRSPAWYCHSCGSHLIPGLGAPYPAEQPKRKKNLHSHLKCQGPGLAWGHAKSKWQNQLC